MALDRSANRFALDFYKIEAPLGKELQAGLSLKEWN
jgi:hypothetical protein